MLGNQRTGVFVSIRRCNLCLKRVGLLFPPVTGVLYEDRHPKLLSSNSGAASSDCGRTRGGVKRIRGFLFVFRDGLGRIQVC